MKKKFTTPQLATFAVIAALVLLIPTLFRNQVYTILLFCFCEIYVIAATGLDVLYGYSGQISFGTSGFFAIGSYASLLVHNYLNVPVFGSMLIAALFTCLIAAIFAYPVSKLRFAFLSLSTIAFNQVVYQFVSRSPGNITGNFVGAFTDKLSLFGVDFSAYGMFFYFGLFFAVLFVALKMMVVRSRVGRAWLAVKQNTHAADGMGINVRKYKVLAFSMYGFYVGFAGAMYVHLVGYVSPETAQQSQSVIFMIMILFGGVCSDLGPVVGAIGIYFIQELLSHAEQYQLLVYGVLLLVFILFLPTGIVGSLKSLLARKNSAKEISDAKGGSE